MATGLQFGIGMFVAPFGDFIIDRLISPFNMLNLSLFLYGLRLYMYTSVYMNPPYQIILLTLFDTVNATLSWIATMKLAYQITPSENFAMVVSLISAVQFNLGKCRNEHAKTNYTSPLLSLLLLPAHILHSLKLGGNV